MQLLALIVVLFAGVGAVAGFHTGDLLVWLLAATSALCAVTTWQSRQISSFLKIFAAIFAVETVIFGSLCLLDKVGLWPESLADYALPESLPLTVAMFAILVYAVSFIPVVRSMTKIADRYFETSDPTIARVWPFPAFGAMERRLAATMIVFLVLLNQAEVGIDIRLSFFSRDWFNAIQAKDEHTFWIQLFYVFIPWAFIYIAAVVTEYVIASTLVIRWRSWLNNFYVDRWLDNHTHYRMQLLGTTSDNPDQRISEDIYRFIDGGQASGYGIYTFTILLIAKLSSLVSYAIILWSLSANFTLPYYDIAVPGFLFWAALFYAGVGTFVTHLLGRSLTTLAFKQQRFEADYRFSLARLREYGEQIALLLGEEAEKATLKQRFSSVIGNYYQIVTTRKKLTAFTSSYGMVSQFIPYFLAAPFYFAGKITFGVMSQTASAFMSVNSALTFFINYYVSLAEFKSVLDRLTSFDAAIEKAQGLGTFRPRGSFPTEALPEAEIMTHLGLENLKLHLPDGSAIVENANLAFRPSEAALLTGPSGSGKSTLLRALSGIWPFGEGTIARPHHQHLMLLPQKPYMPIGTLRSAITYPADPLAFEEETVRETLRAVKLERLIDKLDVEDLWAQRLSGGEQQRLAIARALLAKPDWLFLDEATSAMDETLEATVYKTLVEKLPATTIVSIGHRSSLIHFHSRHIEMRGTQEGSFTLVEISAPKAAE
ncbi:ABC transporter ATP-binding protein/permease [Beijerinckia indica]|uniref:ABC transporter domain protein n=1 Tax=Beijerinckia indica subsp. indica (strain ATCC 9039 / DSM 1715 / NCIMB 8712) TaxID=395963 RepID=B2ICU6_BEII9|nr:ABC transporter ATP-binding protein/permease [Beijerinckia indica]ACB95370.1 ABC transporter domain protein [Beijerinckia indica subsp. indica ATCC 9039]